MKTMTKNRPHRFEIADVVFGYKLDTDEWNFQPNEFYSTWDNPEWALQEYIDECDSNSVFVDGYPDEWEYHIRGADGITHKYLVSTDWSPDFWVSEKKNEG